MNYEWNEYELYLYDENLLMLDARQHFIDWCDKNKYIEYEKNYNRDDVSWTPVNIDSLMKERDIVIDFIQSNYDLFGQVEEE